jgi:hypothetical protein
MNEIEKQIDDLVSKALERRDAAGDAAVADAIEDAMSGDEASYKRALEELLEALELAWEWATNEHGEEVRVVSLNSSRIASARREAYALLRESEV